MGFYIYSNQHRAYWRDKSCGYTANKGEAGIYSYQEAVQICTNANRYQSPGDLPNEVMVPVTE